MCSITLHKATVSDTEEEEDMEGEEGQEYLFFDIESRQDDERHITNLLIGQDETAFEMVFKGDDCDNQFSMWFLDRTHHHHCP